MIPFYFPSYWFRDTVQRNPKIEPYRYWDTPDYEDTHKKVYIAAKWGFYTALGFSVADIFAVNRNPSYMKSIGRLFGNLGRIGGTFVLGSAITHTVANFRHKDDELNWMIGCGSTGLIWGFKTHNPAIGTGTAVFGALIGWMIKRAEKEHWVIFPRRDLDDIMVQNGALGGQRYGDWRIQALRPKSYHDPGDHCREN